MSRSAISRATSVAILTILPAIAQAQELRTWVSGLGDDVNPCTRAAPCKTFAGVISKTARNGEINVLDGGGFGTVVITKSITINGTPGFASILAAGAGTDAILIRIADPNDVRRTVRINGLDINGQGSAANGIRIYSDNLPGTSVMIENTSIDRFAGRGISDERVNGGKLTIVDTVVRHTQDSAIRIAAGDANRIDATLANVRAHNSAIAALTVNGGAKAMITNSVFSGSTFGLDIEQAGTEAIVDHSLISGNSTGLLAIGGALLRLSNSEVTLNGTGVNGAVNSFGNNRFSSNGAGGTITPVGIPSSDNGQQ